MDHAERKSEKVKRKTLFIDARNLGHMIDRRVRELSEDDIQEIASTYHRWRTGKDYEDIVGFCKEASTNEIAEQDYILTPAKYVGIAEDTIDNEPFEQRMNRLTSELSLMFEKSIKLQEEITEQLKLTGFKM